MRTFSRRSNWCAVTCVAFVACISCVGSRRSAPPVSTQLTQLVAEEQSVSTQPIQLVSEEQFEDLIGSRVVVSGVAQNRKLDPFVSCGFYDFRLRDGADWPSAVHGRQVEVIGVLKRREPYTEPEYDPEVGVVASDRMPGEKVPATYYLESVTWRGG